MGIGDALKELTSGHEGRLRFARRLAILIGFIVVAVILSTLDFGDDPQSDSFEGDFFLGLIPLAVVIFVGVEAVRWLRLEGKRRRQRWRER